MRVNKIFVSLGIGIGHVPGFVIAQSFDTDFGKTVSSTTMILNTGHNTSENFIVYWHGKGKILPTPSFRWQNSTMI